MGYQSAFMGCFCDCHFASDPEDLANLADPASSQTPGKQHIVHLPALHPVYQDSVGAEPAMIVYQDEQAISRTLLVSSLYQQERVLPRDKCDSILTKIIYSQAQFKAAEENAQ